MVFCGGGGGRKYIILGAGGSYVILGYGAGGRIQFSLKNVSASEGVGGVEGGGGLAKGT